MKLKLLVLAIASALSAGAFAAEQTGQQKSQSGNQPMSQPSGAQDSQQPARPGAQAQVRQQDRVRDPSQHAQGMSSDAVKQAQQALKDKGHDVGPIDGRYGPLTQKGVKEFQEKQNMKATGRLDQETLSALGVQEGSSAVGAGADKKETKKKDVKKDSKKDENKTK